MSGLLAHQAHSDTSKEAAQKAEGQAPTQRERVLVCLRMCPAGLTDEEMQEMLDMNPSTQRPRRIELMDAGLIRKSGWTRRTRAGRRATVWLAAKAGQMELGGCK